MHILEDIGYVVKNLGLEESSSPRGTFYGNNIFWEKEPTGHRLKMAKYMVQENCRVSLEKILQEHPEFTLFSCATMATYPDPSGKGNYCLGWRVALL